MGVVYVVETLVWSVGEEAQGTVCHRVGRGWFEEILLFTLVIYGVGEVGVLRLFTGGLFTVQSGMLHLSAVAVSSDVVPVHCVPVGLSNIKGRGSQSQVSMIGSRWPAHWVGRVFCMRSA